MKDQLIQSLEAALGALLRQVGDEDALPEVTLEVPRQAGHGDFSTNAAMLLAKRLRKAPRAIAEELVELLGDADGLLQSAEVAGPGFVNFRLRQDSWQELVRRIIEQGPAFGRGDTGAGRKVQVELVSANPTGPLSTGHGRQAVLGDCIARLLDFAGWDVTREYYFNDGGRQMRVLGDSTKARYMELLGKAAPPPADALANADADWPESVDGLPVLFPQPPNRVSSRPMTSSRSRQACSRSSCPPASA